MKEGISKGMNMKWSSYMSSNQQNLTVESIGLKIDYRVDNFLYNHPPTSLIGLPWPHSKLCTALTRREYFINEPVSTAQVSSGRLESRTALKGTEKYCCPSRGSNPGLQISRPA